ncbi:hypothetical protein MUO79_11600 [Candidatus Bathyarchaeota archaeon]|nr:hypothetical protein [Candidatus Bathyarchaeota archaeon]
MEELDKMAFKCLKCGEYFFLIDGKLIHAKKGEVSTFAGMTMCPACTNP